MNGHSDLFLILWMGVTRPVINCVGTCAVFICVLSILVIDLVMAGDACLSSSHDTPS